MPRNHAEEVWLKFVPKGTDKKGDSDGMGKACPAS